MSNKQIFTPEEMKNFSNVLERTFKKTGLADILRQENETTNNHLNEEFFQKLAAGYHLEKDNALNGT